jgi:hypothetical protein
MNTMAPRVYPSPPDRVVVGTDYLYKTNVIRSLTQLRRLEKSGRITPWFKLGSRRVQWKDVVDSDVQKLLAQAGRDTAA